MTQLKSTHEPILKLHQAMLNDEQFRTLCTTHGLPWDIESGYEPRWYNGPPPEDVQLLFLMAEPGPITKTEALNLRPAISNDSWLQGKDFALQEKYWLLNLKELCEYVWPVDTEQHMDQHLGGSCTFWMSLPHGITTAAVPKPLTAYFSKHYLPAFLELFPNALILAAGAKARDRLQPLQIEFEACWAFTRPGCNQKKAHDSWAAAGRAINSALNQRRSTASLKGK